MEDSPVLSCAAKRGTQTQTNALGVRGTVMALQWVTGTVAERKVWAEGLFTISVRCPGVQKFEAGQFLQVGMPLGEKHLHRPYSVASPHGDVLDFFIVRVDGGELTPRLWSLEVGEPIDVSMKATGSFTLGHVPESQTLWLVATGTGLAPYIAMLREATVWSRFAKVVLLHGVRFNNDLAYQPELASIKEQYGDRFHFIPVVSREATCEGVYGRITTAMDSGELEDRASARFCPEESAVMLCGNPLMLDDVEARLKDRGMQKHKISAPGQYVLERYW